MFQASVNHELNRVCNNAAFTVGTIFPMAEELHESARRLYDMAERLLGAAVLPAAMAKLLNESPQVVTNWGRRGISERGALKAQAAIGVDANWLLTGEGVAFAGWPFPRVEAERYLQLSSEDRAWVQSRLQQAIEECENGHNGDSGDVLKRARGVFNNATARPNVKKRRTG